MSTWLDQIRTSHQITTAVLVGYTLKTQIFDIFRFGLFLILRNFFNLLLKFLSSNFEPTTNDSKIRIVFSSH